MSSCEKCWADVGGDAERYRQIIVGRNCTPEQQAGPYAGHCVTCGRMTIHQYSRQCMNGCVLGLTQEQRLAVPPKGVKGEVGRCYCGAYYYRTDQIGQPCEIQYCRGTVKSAHAKGATE